MNGLQERQQKQRGSTRRRGFYAWNAYAGLDEIPDGPNPLLVHAVIDNTFLQAYHNPTKEFLAWVIEKQVPIDTDEALDVAVARRMAHLCYIERTGVGAGANLLAGILHVWPEKEGNFPESARALKSWGRLDPGGAGEAVSIELALCMAERMRADGHLEAALFTECNIDTYWRQQDGFNLLVEDVVVLKGPSARGRDILVALNFGVARRGERSKTGVDQGVILDRSIIAHRLADHIQGKAPSEKVFRLSRQAYHDIYYDTATSLGVEVPPPHSLRHCGPSFDAYTHFRTEAEIQRRGRWEALSSVKRYSRPSWYASVLARTPSALIAHGRELLEAGFVRQVFSGDID